MVNVELDILEISVIVDALDYWKDAVQANKIVQQAYVLEESERIADIVETLLQAVRNG
jgi:hypothetical protein